MEIYSWQNHASPSCALVTLLNVMVKTLFPGHAVVTSTGITPSSNSHVSACCLTKNPEMFLPQNMKSSASEEALQDNVTEEPSLVETCVGVNKGEQETSEIYNNRLD